MARYGRGYYRDLSSLIVGVKDGLHEALDSTGKEMCERIKEIVQERLYDKYTPTIYVRLGSDGGVLDSVNYRVDKYKDEIQFFFDDSVIRVETQESGMVAHKYINDNYSTEDMVEKWSKDSLHDDILFAVRQLLFEFPKIYREKCKKNGLYLTR
jgi:hypothetical protein